MNAENSILSFTVQKQGLLFQARCEEKKTLEATFEKGMLTLSILYDFDPLPLSLTAAAKEGDKAEVVLLPYRLELYINGILMDEEWPCGNHFLTSISWEDMNCSFAPLPIKNDPKEKPPAILGTFEQAEGWKPEENVFVGDCMPFEHEGVYHVLYLKDRHHHCSKWRRGAHQWSHISTKDWKTWNIHPMAVEIDDPREGSICTGSWIFSEGVHYLFYTVRMCDGSPARICRSLSEDGYHFEKDRSFSFSLSSRFDAPDARDPKIIRDAQGLFHMILTTSLSENRQGCLAHLISKDLTEWTELDEVAYLAPKGMGEPECPDYFYKDGYYYLVFSLRGKGHYQYSRKPFSGWQTPEDPIIPCKSVPKAAIWQDRLIFSGFCADGCYAGTLTFLEALVQKDGQLLYRKLQ